MPSIDCRRPGASTRSSTATRQVGVVDLQVLDVAAERRRRRRAALLEADVAGLLDDAERVLHACLVELLAGSLAGDRLALADVGDRAEVLPLVDAGVDRDDRDAGGDGLLDAVLEAVGLAIETTRPSYLSATALSISVHCLPGSGSLL